MGRTSETQPQRPSFRTTEELPVSISQEERSSRIIKAIQMMQAVERDYIGKDEVTVRIAHNRPIMIVTVADLHMGSIATDYDAVEELKQMILSDPDICVVLLGDEIEGLVSKYLDTNAARTIGDVHQQIDLVKNKFIKPLADEGRIVGMVSGYFGHNGWAQDSATINTWIMMAEGFGIPVIRNGGKIRFLYKNGHSQVMQIFHNSPGKSNFDPVYGLRNALLAQSLPGRPQIAAGGHYHRAGIEKSYFPNIPPSKKPVQAMVLLNTGTAKSSNTELPPDRFGIKLGLPLSDELGQAVLLAPRTRNSGRKLEVTYPVLTIKHGPLAFAAIQLLDRLEAQAMTQEMRELVMAEVEAKPEIIFQSRSSMPVKTPYAESTSNGTGDASSKSDALQNLQIQYASLNYDIRTRLPISVDVIQNVRVGSKSEGIKPLATYMEKRFSNNPHALMVFLRNMVDSDVAADVNRMQTLNRLIELAKKYPEQVVALMLDGNLRRKEWKKSVGDGNEHVPIAAGSFLAGGIGTKLVRHQSVLKLSIGQTTDAKNKPTYTSWMLDGLGNHASFMRPTAGLVRNYQIYPHTKPGVVMGGHTPNAGISSLFDKSNPETDNPYFVAGGWWADTQNVLSKRNSGPGAIPGQSVIFMPGDSTTDYLAFATSNPEETELFHKALLLWQGLGILDLRNKVQ